MDGLTDGAKTNVTETSQETKNKDEGIHSVNSNNDIAETGEDNDGEIYDDEVTEDGEDTDGEQSGDDITADGVDTDNNESTDSIEEDETLIRTDDNGKVYTDANGKLLPNNEYVLNGNVYRTDDKGRIISCDATPKTDKAPRNENDQARAGGEDRKEGDQGGHIVASEHNGHGDIGNLFPLDARINGSDYRVMENQITKALNENEEKTVTTHTEFVYSGDSERPDKIIVTVTIDGVETVYTFDNNLDGSLMDKVAETCNESDIDRVDRVLNETGGEISCVKEEYDANGNLVKTSVTITYKDENGVNMRVKVTIDHTGGTSK